MEPLGDDELFCIFNRIHDYYIEDKRSFVQVSKKFMKIACFGLYRLYNCFPDLLFDILPSSPNLRKFQCYKQLSNTHLKLLAQSCPKLKTLKLGIKLDPSESGEFDSDLDFDEDGLCAVVNACSHLRKVYLNRRLNVGDAGILSLLTLCKNLLKLNLKGCIRVTDESLKAIGESGIWNLNLGGCCLITDAGIVPLVTSCKTLMNLNLEKCIRVTDKSLKAIGESGISNLNLGGCCLITDLGLEFLANGDLKNSLHTLTLSECDKISDNGLIHLNQMVGLIELHLHKCGVHITKSGIDALISDLPKIEMIGLDKQFC